MLAKNKILMLLWIPFLFSACNKEQVSESENVEKENGDLLDTALEGRLEKMADYEVGPDAFPRSMEGETVRGVPSSDWTSGFLPGSLWYAFRLTGDSAYLEKAKAWTWLVEQEKFNDRTHDMGFKVYCSFGNAYEITQEPEFKEVILESASTLASRYNPRVGCIKSWDFGQDRWSFPVIIDNMMNLELLFEATQLSGDSTYHKMAYSHALRTLQNHYRVDNSSVHVVDYNPLTGEVIKKITHQGYNDESSWARGQAWGLYGFAMAYRYTEDEQFLEQARNIYDFLFQHPNTPEDKIFYWDFDDPAIPNVPRDASAAAITASALLELYKYDEKEAYLETADAILSALSSPKYMLEESDPSPFILTHSTGNMPKEDEIDVPLSYADYYFLEALWRRKNLE